MTYTNLFGEPEPAEVATKPIPAKTAPVKSLLSSQYYTLSQAAALLKMDVPEARHLLDRRVGRRTEPTLTPETEPIYGREAVNRLLHSLPGRENSHDDVR